MKDREERMATGHAIGLTIYHSCYSSDAWTTAWIEKPFVGSDMTVSQRLHLCLKLRDRLTECE